MMALRAVMCAAALVATLGTAFLAVRQVRMQDAKIAALEAQVHTQRATITTEAVGVQDRCECEGLAKRLEALEIQLHGQRIAQVPEAKVQRNLRHAETMQERGADMVDTKVGLPPVAVNFEDVSSVSLGLDVSVPIGTVLDWWRVDPAVPVPDGYEICDGTPVRDPSSPIFEKPKLNLTSFFTKAEVKVFSTDSCPEGWSEIDNLKGYLLTGRPNGGTTMELINKPWRTTETDRVGSHQHSASVNDPGHEHDPKMGDNMNQPPSDPKSGNLVWSTGGSRISWYPGYMSPARTGVDVSIDKYDGEGYPLAYVLLCEQGPASAEHGLIKIVRVI